MGIVEYTKNYINKSRLLGMEGGKLGRLGIVEYEGRIITYDTCEDGLIIHLTNGLYSSDDTIDISEFNDESVCGLYVGGYEVVKGVAQDVVITSCEVVEIDEFCRVSINGEHDDSVEFRCKEGKAFIIQGQTSSISKCDGIKAFKGNIPFNEVLVTNRKGDYEATWALDIGEIPDIECKEYDIIKDKTIVEKSRYKLLESLGYNPAELGIVDDTIYNQLL